MFTRISMLAVLFLSAPVLALELQNGNFSSGLASWTTSGPVSVQGGAAVMTENPEAYVTWLKQTFDLPTDSQSLTFRYGLNSSPDQTKSELFPDSFQASLLDAVTLKPLVQNGVFSDYFFVDRTGLLDLASEVTLDGDKVMLDLTGLVLPRSVILKFEEYAGPDGYSTTVWIDDVLVEPRESMPPAVPEPMTLLGLPLALAAAGGYLRRLWKK